VDGDRESGRTGGGKKLLKYKKIEKKKKEGRIWSGEKDLDRVSASQAKEDNR
jgi:hypothetical protein